MHNQGITHSTNNSSKNYLKQILKPFSSWRSRSVRHQSEKNKELSHQSTNQIIKIDQSSNSIFQLLSHDLISNLISPQLEAQDWFELRVVCQTMNHLISNKSFVCDLLIKKMFLNCTGENYPMRISDERIFSEIREHPKIQSIITRYGHLVQKIHLFSLENMSLTESNPFKIEELVFIIKKCPNLVDLNLINQPIMVNDSSNVYYNDDHLDHTIQNSLLSLKKLEILSFGNYEFASQGSSSIKNGNFLAISDKIIKSLEKLTYLKELHLINVQCVSNIGLKPLQFLTELEKLTLYNGKKITHIGIKKLKPLKKLNDLNIVGCHLDLSQQDNLNSLNELLTNLVYLKTFKFSSSHSKENNHIVKKNIKHLKEKFPSVQFIMESSII